jgi:ATP-binding protein involved in chromosome partitioning
MAEKTDLSPRDAALAQVVLKRFAGHHVHLQSISTTGDGVVVVVEVAAPGPAIDAARLAAVGDLEAMPGIGRAQVILTAHKPHGPAPEPRPRPNPDSANGAPANGAPASGAIAGVNKIIAVASGKGGVGKSTTAVNIALALQGLGLNVALLDADIYGPSVPRLLGLRGKPQTKDKKLLPMVGHGLAAMSIGFLVDEDTPVIWRGPMVMSALTQMCQDVIWTAPSGRNIDVMVIDMPPGTGDAQMTIAQRLSLAGAVIVSTPQDIALIDARKGLAMFEKTRVPILGIVENMSLYICPNCGHEAHIFGHGGARETAAELGAEFLGEVPLHLSIRQTSDAGTPIVVESPNSAEAGAYRAIAARIAEKLAVDNLKPPPRIVYV